MAKTIEESEFQAQFNKTQRECDAAYAAALAGQPMPDAKGAVFSTWIAGDVKRRVLAKEVLGFVSQGTRCKVCGDQNWGWRAGCRCTQSDDGAVEWGFLVDDGLNVCEAAKFMTQEEVLAIGLPLVDLFTGKSIATKES